MSVKNAIFSYLTEELAADADRFDSEDIEEMTDKIMEFVERYYSISGIGRKK